jgi:hypothetical protein
VLLLLLPRCYRRAAVSLLLLIAVAASVLLRFWTGSTGNTKGGLSSFQHGQLS